MKQCRECRSFRRDPTRGSFQVGQCLHLAIAEIRGAYVLDTPETFARIDSGRGIPYSQVVVPGYFNCQHWQEGI